MKITYDEYVATWQAPEAKDALDSRIESDNAKRHAQRMRGVGEDPSSKDLLENMSQEEFKSLRRYQMHQLLQAYRDSRSGKTHNLLSISQGTTNPSEIRKVVGQKAGYIYNNGALALDYDTIVAVNHIASLMESSKENVDNRVWENINTPLNLEKVVDEMIAVKGILTDNLELENGDLVGDKIYRETNIVKRAIGKALPRERGMNLPDGSIIEYDDSTLPKVGKNCFDIKDFELSWEQLMDRKISTLAATKYKLFGFLDKKINPNAERNDPNKVGNRTFNYEAGGR